LEFVARRSESSIFLAIDHSPFGFFLSAITFKHTATEIYPQRSKDMTWDVMHAAKVEVLRGPTGRLLQYDPSTDQVTVLARDLYFANGVAVAEDESYLVFVETFYSRVTKYYLTGEKKGTTEFVIDGYPSPACTLLRLSLVDSKCFNVVSSSSFCFLSFS
jgi:hypothetical protein